jgi:hypothetical protein
MKKYSFSNWIQKRINEYADYGFASKAKRIDLAVKDSNEPFKHVNVDTVCRQLRNINIGIKESVDSFPMEVQWGNDTGAIKLFFYPYGGLRCSIRRLGVDMQGENVWVCKKVIPITQKYDENQDTLIFDLREKLEHIDKEGIDGPSGQYNKLETLVLHLASALNKTEKHKILMYEGIRRIKENRHYIIHFGCMGMGVQAMGQHRLDQFQVDVRYIENRGCILINGQDVGDDIASHKWVTAPADIMEYYFPSQPEKEIIDSIQAHLSTVY